MIDTLIRWSLHHRAAIIAIALVLTAIGVILAGGAWTSLFCAGLRIRLPQLKVLSSVLRTAPLAGGPDTCAYMTDLGYRKRRDGGYTIARGSGFVVPIVPDSFRYLREFLPTMRKEAAGLKPRLNGQSWFELWTPRRWALDRPGPFEKMRVLDPAPNKAMNREALNRLSGPRELHIVPGATHLFEEPGALQLVAQLATKWFLSHLR